MKIERRENKISNIITKIAIILLITQPIYFSLGMLFLNKNTYCFYYNYIFASLCVIGFVLLPIMFFEKFRFKFVKYKDSNKTVFFAYLFLFLCIVWATISVFFATDISLALFDIKNRGEGLFMYYAYALIALGAYTIDDDKFRNTLLKIFMGVGIFFCLYTLFDHYVFRWGEIFVWWPFTAPFANPNHSGYFLVMVSIVSASLFMYDKDTYTRWVGLITFTLASIVICLNDSFGSQLTIFCMVIAIVIASIIRDKTLWKRYIFVIGAYLISIIIGHFLERYTLERENTVLLNFVTFIKDIFMVVSNVDSKDAEVAGTNRWGLWMECFRNMRDKPLFGIGINCQRIVNPNLESSRPHNELLQFASTMGIPAGIFYLTSIILLAISTIKQIKNISSSTLTCLLTVCAYFISSLFGVSLPYTFCYYVVFLGLGISGLKLKKDKTFSQPFTQENNKNDNN